MKLLRLEDFNEDRDLSKDGFELLAEMADVCRLTLSYGPVIVRINPKERTGDVPHFHIHLKDTQVKDDICVKIASPEYFIHGTHNGTLNSKDRKKLQRILEETDNEGMTNWEFLRRSWNRYYPDRKITDKTMPNYRDLPDKF